VRALVKSRAKPGLWIRTQLSAAYTAEDVDHAVAQFAHVKEELSL